MAELVYSVRQDSDKTLRIACFDGGQVLDVKNRYAPLTVEKIDWFLKQFCVVCGKKCGETPLEVPA